MQPGERWAGDAREVLVVLLSAAEFGNRVCEEAGLSKKTIVNSVWENASYLSLAIFL